MGDFRTPYQWRYKNSLSQRDIKLKSRSPNKFSRGHDITTSNHALLQGEVPQKNHTYKTFVACFIPPKQGSHLMTPVSVSSILPLSTRAANSKWHLVQLQLRCSRFRWRREPAKPNKMNAGGSKSSNRVIDFIEEKYHCDHPGLCFCKQKNYTHVRYFRSKICI